MRIASAGWTSLTTSSMSGCMMIFLSAALHASSFCLNYYSPTTTNSNANSPPPFSRIFASQSDSATTAAGVFTAGRLVEFTTGNGKSKSASLGTIIGPDGKRNLKILTSSGRTASVPPKSVRHVVPNGISITTEDEIAQHEQAAADALKRDLKSNGQSVVDVWEMLLEDEAETVDLPTLADLIVGDDSSLSCYAARAVLQEGVEHFCFKEIGSAKGKLSEDNIGSKYEPRSVDIVESMRAQAKAEAEEQARWIELKQRIDDACNDADIKFDIDNETEEIQSALKSLERLGCLANSSRDEANQEEKKISASREFLKKIGRRATPDAAHSLLVGIGVWDVHTNLDLIRLRTPTAFSADLEDLAAQIATNPPPDVDEASRLDLTHLPAFAIDEASTKEIDTQGWTTGCGVSPSLI